VAVVRFGVFELDLETGELHRLGRRVHLTAQAAKVLTLIAGRPGEVVTRDELKRHLWGRDTFVDFDRGLNFCVSAARAALRDSARNPTFIETLPRRGYRFIAETVAIDPLAAPAEAPRAGSREAASRVARSLVVAAATLLLVFQRPVLPLAHTRATARPDAREAFTRALDAPLDDAAALRRSVAALKLATQLDPRFAEAHYALADIYLKLAIRHELPMAAALAESEAAARRAIALEDVAETREVLATVRLIGAWDVAGARRELAHALALAPKWDIGHAAYARVLSAVGDDAAAIRAIDRAETISPTCELILADAGTIYARAGRFTEAIGKLRRAIDLGPPRSMTPAQWHADVQFRLLRIAVARGDWTAAHEAAVAILVSNGAAASVRDRFERTEPREAVQTFLRRSIERATASATNARVSPTRVATLLALVDDRETAIGWLETAAAERDPDLIYALRDPDFDRLRESPRFVAIERRTIGLP
jgi:DNA-binding winged helix-turn-helix (wHTH) protein